MPIMTKDDHSGTFQVLVTVDLASAAAVTAVPQNMTVPGVDPASDSCLAVEPQTALATGIALGQCRVSALNTITVPVINPTAGAVDQGSIAYKVIIARR